MKEFIVVILIFISNYSSAQISNPLPDSTGAWIYSEAWGGGTVGPYYYETYRYYVDGDTVINSFQYNVLYKSSIILSDSNQNNIVGYYRVDGQKVYFLDEPTFSGSFHPYTTVTFGVTGEILLYDFGLQIGDTFLIATNDSLLVTAIDSMQFNGNYLKKISFTPITFSSQCALDYYWIEGIGSVLGLFPYYYCFENSIVLHCFHANGNDYVFYLPPGNTCQHLTIGIEELSAENNFKVYPNPTSEFITIENNLKVNESAGLYRSDGTLVNVYSIQDVTTIINVNTYSKGLYFLRIGAKVYPLVLD